MEVPGAVDHLYLNLYGALPLVPPPLPIPTSLATNASWPSSSKKKNKIQWLGDDTHRRATFRKRRKGIMKKAEELHILCGVKTCAIIYGPGEQQPEVWPSAEEAARICRGFRQMPELQQLRMMCTNTHFLQEQVSKKAQQLSNQHDEIAVAQARCYLYDGLLGGDLRGVSRECLVRVHGMIQDTLRECYEQCTTQRARPRAADRSSMPSSAELPAGGRASPEHPRGAISAMRLSTGEAPMEALVNRFLYGEGTVPTEGSSSWGGGLVPTSEPALPYCHSDLWELAVGLVIYDPDSSNLSALDQTGTLASWRTHWGKC
ncbi:hypothetical protein Taro_033150 [Colocasia esculenta]|uniref:MADS-box domain-containing protein n=1 Tax=Colocasia esculenta TaxID=4460 RepID=A0A843W633_COLES|nr:hypothetical protein [Colocasia esculenta]